MDVILDQPNNGERTKFWRDPLFENLEVLHATYITHAFTRHSHDGYAIGVIERGGEKFDYGRRKFVAPAGSVVVINPGEPHTGSTATEVGWSYRMFYPDSEILRRIASQMAGRERDVPFFAAPVLRDEQLGSLMGHLHRTLEKSPSALERQSQMLYTLSLLITRYADNRPSLLTLGREPDAVRRVKEFIQAHYSENITLDELAAVANLSQFHLARVFQKETGFPPHTYLTQVRVSRAKRLLDLNLPLAQVASDTGFTDQSHLSRHFKRIVGVPPGQYRNLL